MTEREQREWWGWTHRKVPSPDEARRARWVERDGRWQTAGRWLEHDRLAAQGYVEHHRDEFRHPRGWVVTLLHETLPDWSDYPAPGRTPRS
jgi:hypothetical protein